MEKVYSKHLQKSISDFEQGLKDQVPHMDLLWGELYGSINSDFWSGVLSEHEANQLRQKYLFREEKPMKLNAIFMRKEPAIEPRECVIEHIELMNGKAFEHFSQNLLRDYSFIEDNKDNMFHAKDGTMHCIMALSEDTGDGILIQSEGSHYARYTAFVPRIKPYIDRQISLAVDKVMSEHSTHNDSDRGIDLEKIAEDCGLTLREGNGLFQMFAEELGKRDAVLDLDYEDGEVYITSKDSRGQEPTIGGISV